LSLSVGYLNATAGGGVHGCGTGAAPPQPLQIVDVGWLPPCGSLRTANGAAERRRAADGAVRLMSMSMSTVSRGRHGAALLATRVHGPWRQASSRWRPCLLHLGLVLSSLPQIGPAPAVGAIAGTLNSGVGWCMTIKCPGMLRARARGTPLLTRLRTANGAVEPRPAPPQRRGRGPALVRRRHRRARAVPPLGGEQGALLCSGRRCRPAPPQVPQRALSPGGVAAASLCGRWRCTADVDVDHVAGPARRRSLGDARPRALAASF